MMLQGQDWTPVTLRKRPPATSDHAALQAARRDGHTVSVEKGAHKNGNGTSSVKGTPGSASGAAAAKLQNETEDFHHDRVPLEVRVCIARQRASKGLTQAELAQKLNVKPQVIQEYESGKAIPDGQMLARIARVLGIPVNDLRSGKRSSPPADSRVQK